MKKLLLFVTLCFNIGNVYSQQWEWTRTAKGINFSQDAMGVAVDFNGNSFVVGMATGNITFDSYTLHNSWFCGVLAKYDVNGNFQWANRAGNFINATATDKEGNVYIAGTNQNDLFTGTGNDSITPYARGNFDVAIAKYAPNGDLLWVRTAGSDKWDEAKSISVDKQGNCYVTGIYRDTADFGNDILPYPFSIYPTTRFFITKLDTEGGFLWTRFGFGPENDYSYVVGSSVSAGADGCVYVTGSFMGGLDLGTGKVLNGQGAFISKYSATGDLLWIKPTGDGDYIPVVSDKIGNCYVTAGKYLSKFDSNGNLIYNKTIIQSSNPNNGQISSIALDTLNNKLFISGRFTSIPTTFGGASNAITLTASKTSFDAFIANFDIDGNLKWVTAPTGGWQGESWAFGVSTDHNGHCFATGRFGGAGATDFGSTHFEDISPVRIFVSKISDWDVTFTTNDKPISEISFSIYPNPTAGVFQLNYSSTEKIKLQLNVIDSKGKKVYEESISQFKGEYKKDIDLGKQAKGVYFIEIIADRKREVERIVLN